MPLLRELFRSTAAGAAAIYTGEPGYAKKDRDGDGVACE
ncbi:excalibur calcium-binding domain-containing protein [Laceyella putida]|uniref:Excalibur calcium-binding domain-containing protein n=1 Tax=Laceyella putida TaxID=110101 RepID=A0ABW2RF67_9BACL